MLAVSQQAVGQFTTSGDIISSGSNSWLFQTPDNGPTTLYVAPSINGSWYWANQTQFLNTGDIKISGRLGIGVDPIIYVANTAVSGMGTMRLAVDGKVGARAFHVTALGAPWPDYVFAPTYRLRPLTEVAEFVQTNCHLPDVPSAADVQAHGLDLGEMDTRLLRKIEELTLYLLEEHRENAALKIRLERLENAPR